MAVTLPIVAIALVVLYYVIRLYRSFSLHLAAAKQSGLPYVILPFFPFSQAALITEELWTPLLRMLPERWTRSWMKYVDSDCFWKLGYEPFRRFGSDVLLFVSPGGCMAFVADPDAISQITTRRNDFPKPIEMYRALDVFGKNVVSTEGSMWRHHRKITAPPFAEKNNHLVWTESLHQARSMVTGWTGGNMEESRKIEKPSVDTMRLSLHVISRAGFGVRLLWPHESAGDYDGGLDSSKAGEGHKLPFRDALAILLEKVVFLMILPKWFLANSPFKMPRVAYEAYLEWGKYMTELFQSKKAEISAGETRQGMDLMGALIQGAGIAPDSSQAQKSGGTKSQAPQQNLTDDEVLGNAFVFTLAGHETTAGTIHYSLVLLALHWRSQKRLQREIDEIFGDRPVSEWDYDVDVPRLFGSMAGAVMNEVLRLIPPVVGIPKSTAVGKPQPLVVNGKRVVIPANSYVYLHTAAVHRHPKYWPGGPPNHFRPERWLLDSTSKPHSGENGAAAVLGNDSDSEDATGPQSPVTSASQFRPLKGAYLPFSDGPRACLGRRFAQVEVLAVLALIFREYSVELALDVSDEALAEMSATERREVWNKGADWAKHVFKNMSTQFTLQMKDAAVPIRLVKRGKERFAWEDTDVRIPVGA